MEKQKFNLPKLQKDDPILSKVFDRILQDPWAQRYIQEHELSHDFIFENLTVFLRFVEENQPCQQCPGLAACTKDPKGYDTLIISGQNELEIAYRKCQKYRLQERTDNQYYVHDFDNSWLEKRIDSIEINPQRHQLIFSLRSIITSPNSSNQHFFIHSEKAVGKSYIAAMFCNELVYEFGKTAAFTHVRSLMEKLRTMIIDNKEEYFALFEKLQLADLLVFDDLGSEKVTEFSVDILTDIIDYRIKANLPIIITSNFTIKELESLYRPLQLKAKRLIIRLNQGFQFHHLDGIDFRNIK